MSAECDEVAAAVEALASRWAGVLAECKAADPRWILDRSVTTLETALTELRAALADAGAADRLRADVHARWHRALDDPAQEPDGPIRDHITSHDTKARAEALEALSADLYRDHDMPPNKDGRSYSYRNGWWDGVHHAAKVAETAARADRIERQGDPR